MKTCAGCLRFKLTVNFCTLNPHLSLIILQLTFANFRSWRRLWPHNRTFCFYPFLSQLSVNPLRCEYFNEHCLLVSYVPKFLFDTKNETHRAPCLITMETAWEDVPLLRVELKAELLLPAAPYRLLPLLLLLRLLLLLLLVKLLRLLKQNHSYYYLLLLLVLLLVPLLRITRIRIRII